MRKVITYGTFDLFHKGHYNILKRAKELGDYLIVGITTEHFDEARGKVNVIDPIMERIENVRRSGFADQIIVEDHEGQFDYLRAFCQLIYLPRTPNISSTDLRKERFRLVRIVIVGTGRIAPRFVAEPRYVSGAIIERAYNPEIPSAQTFEKTEGTPCDTQDYISFLRGLYRLSP